MAYINLTINERINVKANVMRMRVKYGNGDTSRLGRFFWGNVFDGLSFYSKTPFEKI